MVNWTITQPYAILWFVNDSISSDICCCWCCRWCAVASINVTKTLGFYELILYDIYLYDNGECFWLPKHSIIKPSYLSVHVRHSNRVVFHLYPTLYIYNALMAYRLLEAGNYCLVWTVLLLPIRKKVKTIMCWEIDPC